MVDHHLRQILLAHAQVERQRLVVVAPEELHAGGLKRRDHQLRLAGGDLPQRRRSLLLYFRMRRQILKRQHIVSRQPQHGVGLQGTDQLAHAQHCRMKAFRSLVVRHDHHRWRARRPHEHGQIQSPGSRRQPRDASSPRASAQMPPDTLKRLRMLKVRQQLADKRKDHALASLADQPSSPPASNVPVNSSSPTQRNCSLASTSPSRFPRDANGGKRR